MLVELESDPSVAGLIRAAPRCRENFGEWQRVVLSRSLGTDRRRRYHSHRDRRITGGFSAYLLLDNRIVTASIAARTSAFSSCVGRLEIAIGQPRSAISQVVGQILGGSFAPPAATARSMALALLGSVLRCWDGLSRNTRLALAANPLGWSTVDVRRRRHGVEGR